MFAHQFVPGFVLPRDTYAAEEKIDGIRIQCEISTGNNDLFTDKKIVPWSRYGILHPLPRHIMDDLAKFPNCILDGEKYVPGKRSYGATEIDNQDELIYGVFDILELEGNNVMDVHYDDRRMLLEHVAPFFTDNVQLLASTQVNTIAEVEALTNAVWARDGEGLILKRRRSLILPGKRPKLDWIKIKAKDKKVLTIIGFVPSRGEINNRGLYATVVIQDNEGNVTKVKTLNDVECRKFESKAPREPLVWRETRFMGKPLSMITNHPDVGRKLEILYQERTPDNNYRHPRWSKWA